MILTARKLRESPASARRKKKKKEKKTPVGAGGPCVVCESSKTTFFSACALNPRTSTHPSPWPPHQPGKPILIVRSASPDKERNHVLATPGRSLSFSPIQQAALVDQDPFDWCFPSRTAPLPSRFYLSPLTFEAPPPPNGRSERTPPPKDLLRTSHQSPAPPPRRSVKKAGSSTRFPLTETFLEALSLDLASKTHLHPHDPPFHPAGSTL